MSESWIFGRHPVKEALRSGRAANTLFIAEGVRMGGMSPLVAMAKQAGIPVKFVPRRKLDQLSEGSPHQGVGLSVSAVEYADLDAILDSCETPFLILLDEVEDPHNLGAIIRTADATGAHAVVIPKRRACGITPTVVKASAGAVEYVPVCRVGNLAETISELTERGVWVFGLHPEGERDFRQVDWKGPCALVVGSEGKGLRELTKKRCDELVSLPSAGRLASLNASVAAGIAMYEVYSQRVTS